ncbi:hypothetical protein [Xenorhabdus anantnagensis]|uniref:Uncharacterized protein n=1 Tax=Xenorhabdus anantnagensis TaxID=3025875 RepID=A0ABT5LYG4_9GAMM|nr:hypothetical protein [Xenorhabdus anantnagensis]MDC9598099.1 hypothetical protein [Xenorhabdus anantnagensis]
MNKDLRFQLNTLSEELDAFYEKEYSSSEEYSLRNKPIKSKIIDLIISSNDENEDSVKNDALFLLFDNTGCQEDVEILNEIISPLFDKKIINDESLDEYLNKSPLSRWR